MKASGIVSASVNYTGLTLIRQGALMVRDGDLGSRSRLVKSNMCEGHNAR